MAPPPERLRRGLSLRWRLTLWTTGWILLVTVILAVSLNVSLSLLAARSGSILPLPYVTPARVVRITEQTATASLSRTLPAVAISPPAQKPLTLRAIPIHVVEAQILQRLRAISAVVAFLAVLGGGFGAYLLTGRLLGRLRQIDDIARRVDARTLGERIDLTGPADELQELAQTLNAMLERLERTVQEQHRFVADVSHELRTPIAILQTNLEVTAENPVAGLEEYRQLAAIMERAVLRLGRLVEQLLLLVREQQPRQPSVVELGPLVEEAVLSLQPLAEQQQVQVQLTGDAAVAVMGDPALLIPLFRNLVENALIYNRPGGSVTIGLARQGSWATVTVNDTGIGIPTSDLPHLFERFYRGGEARTRQPEGSGLGLAIVDQVVRQHGGTIMVESHRGVGTTVIVRLPLAAGADVTPGS